MPLPLGGGNGVFMSLAANIMVYFIIIAGIVIGVLLFLNYTHLSAHYGQINAALNWNKNKTMLNRKTKELENMVEAENVTPETIIRLETEFNEICSRHEMLSQLIPLFPLLGILGTVMGLMGQLTAGDISTMFRSLGGALNTTFVGLVCAIALKLIDTLLPGKVIYDTEVKLDNYQKLLTNSIQMNNISE